MGNVKTDTDAKIFKNAQKCERGMTYLDGLTEWGLLGVMSNSKHPIYSTNITNKKKIPVNSMGKWASPSY